jgi:hypothetical protein
MNAKEILEQLRQRFNELTGPAPVQAPVALLDAKLADGTAVQITELVVGGIVTINGTPAPAGEHTLEDGTVLVVGDNGAIMEIKPAASAEPAPENVVSQDMGAKFSAFEVSTNEKFASYENKFSAYEARFSDYEAKLNKATTIIEGLIQLTQTLADAPTGAPDPAAKTSANFSEAKKEPNYSLLFS